MSLLKNLFNKNGDQLARQAIDDYSKGRDEFSVISKLQKALKLGIDKYPLDLIYLHIGSSYFDLSIFDKAKEAYEKAYEINPSNSSVVSNLGISYNKLGESEKAVNLYFDAIKINPKNSFAYHNVGLYYYDCGDHFKALEYLEKAIQINPGLSVSYSVISRCLAHIGRFNEASKFLKEAKVRGYDNVDGLKRDLEEINNSNPEILWNKEKFNTFVAAISDNDSNLLLEIQNAIDNPLAFFKENEIRFEKKHFTSFEIYNLIPFNLLLDYLSDKKQLVALNQDDNGYNLICDIENLLNEKYSFQSDLLDEFKSDYLDYEISELLDCIASKLKINSKLEIIDIYYHPGQLLLTVLETDTWNKIKYPFTNNEIGVGRIRQVANDETIKDYLTRIV